MRVNIYAEEMTEHIEIIGKEIDGTVFTGCRFYLHLPVTVGTHPPTEPVSYGDPASPLTHQSVEGGPEVFAPINGKPAQVRGPFIHHPGDDDSSAVTFWGKRDLRVVLRRALELLDQHYEPPETFVCICGAAIPTRYAKCDTVDCGGWPF